MTAKNGELFARFAIESKKITKTKVRPKLFEPRKDGTLSVQNIDGYCKSEVVKAGTRVANKNHKTLYGWAKITRTIVEEIDLSVCIDNKPWPGHAIIRGWPKERNARLDKQKLLAAYSCGVLL